MTILKLENFAGIAPRYSPRLLPQNGATTASNCKLLSGELRGLHETQLLHDFTGQGLTSTVARAYRLPATTGAPLPIGPSDTWLAFYDPNVDFVRTPVVADSFERYYWTGNSNIYGGIPQYSTRALLNTAAPAPPQVGKVWKLGIPTPVGAPAVAPPAGSTSTRVYVYTFVSGYGEEGPPSPPTTATGTTGTWAITGMDTTIADPTARNLTTVNIYRTVTGALTTNYYFVGSVAFGTSSFNDTVSDNIVQNNNTLPSLTWTQPPSTLLGLCAHPGGFLVGFSGRDLWMSEPYHPHAWPLQYVQTMQTEIVGVAIYGNVIVVTTTSHPYVAEGMSPLGITFQKIDSIDPCLNRRSMATTINGVYYSSPQGIIACTGGITQLATANLFTREEWQTQFSPTTVQAVPYGMQVIAFDTSANGFIFSPVDPNSPLTTLDRFSNVAAIQIDSYSGDVYLVQGPQVRLWDPPASIPYSYTWVSKQFDLPNPVNFGAIRIKFNATPITVSPTQLADYTAFNAGRINRPLNTTNLAVINGVRVETTLAVPVQSALATASGGSLAANTYYYVVTATNTFGETIASNEQNIATGASGKNTVTWAAVPGATGYKIYRGTGTGAENVFYSVGAVTTFLDTGGASTAGTPPATNTALLSNYAGAQIRNPVGGSPLFPISSFTTGLAAVQVDVYARNNQSQWIDRYSRSITTEGTYRLPAGFKSDAWQISLIGNTNVYSVTLAETPKELKKA